MADYIIEQGIPLPPVNRHVPWNKRHNATATLKCMYVGDSIYIEDCTTNQATNMFSKPATRLGMKLAFRRIDGGVRIWRIK